MRTAEPSRFGLPAAQVLTDPLTLRARAHDASHVLLHPCAVAVPRDATDVARLLRGCAAVGIGLTFRSGGTSLSGQAGTAGVLADVRRHFEGIDVLDSGARVRVQPGATVGRVNAHLAAYGRKLGPDPASAAACTVGGVVANNSSGMACGTVENAYRTVESLVVVLASGTILDTGAPNADERLRHEEPVLYEGLLTLRDRVRGNPASVATLTRLFAMKNTMGYGLNAFLDHSRPADILTHLMIGSEGTLGFVAEATLRTVPVRQHVRTGLLVFPDLMAANEALEALVSTRAATLELMDTASLRVGQGLRDCPAAIADLALDAQASLLVEYQATTPEELAELVAGALPTLAGLRTVADTTLTADRATHDQLWVVRSGLYTAVAAARRPGTTALLEDVVVPVPALGETCAELGWLFDEYGYADSVIFGHAKDGNIHFMITDAFDRELDRYERFTAAMVDLVLGQGGSLKAEHGTGRIMAPFVARQYGDELYAVMTEVKRLFDPGRLLGDGVLLSDDPTAHLKHIKVPVAVDPLVDACVECGYCEPVCPARHLTLTPRQRIASQRELAVARASGDDGLATDLARAFQYAGLDTCAVDGLCGLACPVGINTGLYVKARRAQAASPLAQRGWAAAAAHWAGATHVASFALSAARSLSWAAPAITAVDEAGRAVVGTDTLPLWSRDLPAGGRSRARRAPNRPPDAVYVPACVNAMFGAESRGARERLGVQVAFESLCARAGLTLVVPAGIDSLCCGTPWTSKGMTRGHKVMAARVRATVVELTDGGRLPVVCDASSCTQGLAHVLADEPRVRVMDAVEFVARRVLPLLGAVTKVPAVTLHQTCSSTELGLNSWLVAVAEAAAERVVVPVDGGCCAFAGDRGMLHPELTASATAAEATEVARAGATVHASCNRTCEIGLARATGQPYRHILEVLADQVLV